MGGLLFGGLGAIAGGARKKKVNKMCNSITVRIVVNNLQNPAINVNLLSGETEVGSAVYNSAMKEAREIASVLAIIKSKAEAEKHLSVPSIGGYQPVSISSEIEKIFELKNRGILTEEEFQKKKRELLA